MNPYQVRPSQPPKKKACPVVAVAVAVVVLLGGGTGLYFALEDTDTPANASPMAPSSRPSGDPEEIARKFGSIVEDQMHRGTTDLSEFEDVSCTADLRTARERDVKIATRPRAKATITVEDVRTEGDTGTFTLAYANPAGSTPSKKPDNDVLKGELLAEDGVWRVCNVFTPTARSSTSAAPSR